MVVSTGEFVIRTKFCVFLVCKFSDLTHAAGDEGKGGYVGRMYIHAYVAEFGSELKQA